jgi:hypothetical protein
MAESSLTSDCTPADFAHRAPIYNFITDGVGQTIQIPRTLIKILEALGVHGCFLGFTRP